MEVGRPLSLRLRRLLACAAAATLYGAPGAAGAEQFRLTISGGTFVDFEGDCRLVDQSGFEALAGLAGSVPQSYAIYAEAVACKLHKSDRSGTFTVSLHEDGKLVARASTRAALAIVSVRSAGPWGAARATISVPPVFQSQLPTLPRGPGLPPLNPPIVPPLRGQSVPPLR
jgi:hypothetical protein